ncbi:MAG TPA: 50S ribosomal protein L29 [Pyrinomonadaceae bacterium]
MKRHEELEKLRGMSDEDLREEAARIKESLFRLNFKLALGEMDAVKRLRQEKRTLARLQTLITERQSGQAAAGK